MSTENQDTTESVSDPIRELDLTDIQAVLFDLDGTIINSLPVHVKAHLEELRKLAQQRNVVIDYDKAERLILQGRSSDKLYPDFLGRDLAPAELEQISSDKEAIYRQLVTPSRFQEMLVPGFAEFYKELRTRAKKIALGTAAPRDSRVHILKLLKNVGIEFDCVVGLEDVLKQVDSTTDSSSNIYQRSKPDPRTYRIICTSPEIRTSPKRSLVFEDSPVGVNSAIKGGIKVVGIDTSHNNLHGTLFNVPDFAHIRII